MISATSYADNTAAASVGAGIAAGAGAVAGAMVSTPEFSSGYTIDQIVNNLRTPSNGVVEIQLDPTPENMRNHLIRASQNQIDELASGKVIKVERGSPVNDAIVQGRIAPIAARIHKLRTMSDGEIVLNNPDLKPSAAYRYSDKAELRKLLEESQRFNGNKFHVLLAPRGSSAVVRAGGLALTSGVVTFMVVKSFNPANAAETPSDGTIPFASTQSED